MLSPVSYKAQQNILTKNNVGGLVRSCYSIASLFTFSPLFGKLEILQRVQIHSSLSLFNGLKLQLQRLQKNFVFGI